MTLCHGDMKLDNLFFKPDHSVVAVDWGVSGWGNPMADLSYFFGRSVETADRREVRRSELRSNELKKRDWHSMTNIARILCVASLLPPPTVSNAIIRITSRTTNSLRSSQWWDEMLDIYYSELTRVNPSLKDTYSQEKMLQDLSYTSLVPFFTICGTLKGLKHQVQDSTGPFAPKDQRSKDDNFKRTWMEDSLSRCADFINDMNPKGSLESNLIKVDPSFPVIPCCCCWMN